MCDVIEVLDQMFVNSQFYSLDQLCQKPVLESGSQGVDASFKEPGIPGERISTW